jgi:hypothetical protein
MALFVKQDETRTRYQEQIAAELQEKLRQKAAQADMPDGVEDSQFVKGTKHTSSSAWVWVLVIVGIVVLVVALVAQSI